MFSLALHSLFITQKKPFPFGCEPLPLKSRKAYPVGKIRPLGPTSRNFTIRVFSSTKRLRFFLRHKPLTKFRGKLRDRDHIPKTLFCLAKKFPRTFRVTLLDFEEKNIQVEKHMAQLYITPFCHCEPILIG